MNFDSHIRSHLLLDHSGSGLNLSALSTLRTLEVALSPRDLPGLVGTLGELPHNNHLHTLCLVLYWAIPEDENIFRIFDTELAALSVAHSLRCVELKLRNPGSLDLTDFKPFFPNLARMGQLLIHRRLYYFRRSLFIDGAVIFSARGHRST